MSSRVITTRPDDDNNVHHICRLCLSKDSLANVFRVENFHRWITDYLSITISTDDGISHAICSACRTRLAEFHLFRVNSQRVQDILPSVVRSSGQINDPEQCKRITNENYAGSESQIVFVELESDPPDSLYCDQQDHDIGIQYEGAESEPPIATEDITFEEVKIEYDAGEANKVGENSAESNRTCNKAVDNTDNTVNFTTVPAKIAKTYVGNECHNLVELMFELDHGSESCTRSAEAANSPDSVDIRPTPFTQNIHAKRKYRKKQDQEPAPEKRKYSKKPTLEPAELKRRQYRKKVYRCDVCSELFPNKMKHFLHQRKHTNSFVCKVCKQAFAEKSTLQRHKQLHSPTDGRRSGRLKENNPRQKPFKCDKCQKAFWIRSTLNVHMESAHGPKVHECNLCGLRFAVRSVLQKHVWAHTVHHEKKEDFQKFLTVSKSILESVANGTTQDAKHKNEAHWREEMECGECHQKFQRKGLMMHFKQVHLKNIKKASRKAAFAKIKALKDKGSGTTAEAAAKESTHAPDTDNPDQPTTN